MGSQGRAAVPAPSAAPAARAGLFRGPASASNVPCIRTLSMASPAARPTTSIATGRTNARAEPPIRSPADLLMPPLLLLPRAPDRRRLSRRAPPAPRPAHGAAASAPATLDAARVAAVVGPGVPHVGAPRDRGAGGP